MKSLTWLAGPLLGSIGIAGAVGHSHASLPKLIQNYRSWRKVTSGRIDMEPGLALSCIGPMKWDRGDNPHVPKTFEVYVNPIGQAAMLRKGKTTFPDGTVIVKEKFNRTDPASAEPVLYTVMSKVAGMWSYFAVNKELNVIPGDGQACAKCHEMNKVNGYVFRPYIQGAPIGPHPWSL